MRSPNLRVVRFVMKLHRRLIRTIKKLIDTSKLTKQFILLSIDAVLCALATIMAFYLRLESPSFSANPIFLTCLLSVVICLPVFRLTGLYDIMLRFVEWTVAYHVVRSVGLHALIFFLIINILRVDGLPRTVGIIQPICLVFLIVGSRLIARYVLSVAVKEFYSAEASVNVMIYGAGSAGMQLAAALKAADSIHVKGFLDDDERLHGRAIGGLKVLPPSALRDLQNKLDLDEIYLAIPSLSRGRRQEIIELIDTDGLLVRNLPSIAEMAEGKVVVSESGKLSLEKLLGRESVPPDFALLSKRVCKKSILITGAGGSIGGELSRQVMALRPKVLLLMENSEIALFSIYHELDFLTSRVRNGGEVKLVPLLCSVQDAERVKQVLDLWRPDIVYHAAAYKHVPLLENNVSEGVKNNIIGTMNVAQASLSASVKDFVLVSTDKAVRPTNLMGATKRVAELVLQGLQSHTASTRFSMVRFGNVLGSSGSVIPKFKSQIDLGGPLTVTHPEVTRFFMTIPEAAQLVLQASALAEGGDVFVLDMGNPVKILDLARRMIILSGLTERTQSNTDGDIEIVFIGLRHGEKLFEELLIGDDPLPTNHPKIMRACENFVSWNLLRPKLDAINEAATRNDAEACLCLLDELVPEFNRYDAIIDWLYCERNSTNSSV